MSIPISVNACCGCSLNCTSRERRWSSPPTTSPSWTSSTPVVWSCTKDGYMSTTERLRIRPGVMHEPWDDLDAQPSRQRVPRLSSSIVPKGSIAGRSLIAVVAIMTFLAALTTVAAMLVVSTANDWQSHIGREVTTQVRPAAGHDIESDVRRATELARGASGIAEVRAYTKEESQKLIEPWLGAGLRLDDLPIPRLVVVKL